MVDKLFKVVSGQVIQAPCTCCGKPVVEENRTAGHCQYCGSEFAAMWKLWENGIDPNLAHKFLTGRRGYGKLTMKNAEAIIWVKQTKGEGH